MSGTPEDRLAALGLELPPPVVLPPDLVLPFEFVNVRGDRAFISGHPKHGAGGKIEGPFGVVGADLTTAEAKAAAADIALSVLSNLKAEIGELSRVAGWGRVFGMVNSAPGYTEQHEVITGFSDRIIEIFGREVGAHARSAIGTAGLPLGFAIEIEAEVLLHPA